MLIWHADAFAPADLARRLAQHGFGWLAVQSQDGLKVTSPPSSWLDAYRAAGGPPVGSWGVSYLDPAQEAALAAQLVAEHGYAFHIADAEGSYKADEAGPEGFARSRAYVEAFRARQPVLPAALSTLGAAAAPWVLPIDWQAWHDGRFALLPQAYLNDYLIYDPVLCAEHAARAGWRPESVHPTIGAYEGLRGKVPASEWVARLEAAGTVGFSVYLGEHMTDDDWQVLGAAVTAGRIARR